MGLDPETMQDTQTDQYWGSKHGLCRCFLKPFMDGRDRPTLNFDSTLLVVGRRQGPMTYETNKCCGQPARPTETRTCIMSLPFHSCAGVQDLSNYGRRPGAIEQT